MHKGPHVQLWGPQRAFLGESGSDCEGLDQGFGSIGNRDFLNVSGDPRYIFEKLVQDLPWGEMAKSYADNVASNCAKPLKLTDC